MVDLFVQDSVMPCMYVASTAQQWLSPFFLSFWTTSENFKILTWPCRFHFLRPMNIRGMREYFFHFWFKFWPSNSLLPSIAHHFVLSEPQGVVEFNLPLSIACLLVMILLGGTWNPKASITDFNSDGNCENFVLPIKELTLMSLLTNNIT